jgi:hypothetical protein
MRRTINDRKFTIVKNCSIVLFRIIFLILIRVVLALMFRFKGDLNSVSRAQLLAS